MELTALFCLLAVMGADVVLSAGWSYEGDTGPLQWHRLFPQACSGKHQSPIDIMPEQTLYNPDLKDFAIWYDPPHAGSSMTLLNNGHSVQVVTDGDYYVTNGGLPYVYKTAQFHFHWGHAKHHGSEHLIDGQAYPLELHIVNWNTDLYEDITEAVTEKQGLAVLGVMFELSEEDNEDLEPVIAAMDQIADPDEGNRVALKPLSTRDLLPDDITKYYRYNGSLTTPGCFESVVWTVFATPRKISHRQLHKFREMLLARPKSHHKRSAHSSPREWRKEKRALHVLDELALNPQQQARFRRDLEAKKNHADKMVVSVDEEDARMTHEETLKAVHQKAEHGGHHDNKHENHHDDDEPISEVEVEFIQERMVNNFRPVQPLNGRLVYRSFKLRPEHSHHSHHASREDDEAREKRIREQLKLYESVGSSSTTSVVSLLLLAVSFLMSLFL